MTRITQYIVSLLLLFTFVNCKKQSVPNQMNVPKNVVKYAKGFSIINYDGFSIVNVTNPWPNANKSYTYILKEKTELYLKI